MFLKKQNCKNKNTVINLAVFFLYLNMSKMIMLSPTVNPYALQTVMGYRGYTQSKLCKNIKGLYQPNLSKFLSGSLGSVSISQLNEIMDFLEWPFDFLYKDIKPINYSHRF